MRLGNVQASLTSVSAFTVFVEYRMRLANDQASLTLLSAFTVFVKRRLAVFE